MDSRSMVKTLRLPLIEELDVSAVLAQVEVGLDAVTG